MLTVIFRFKKACFERDNAKTTKRYYGDTQ